MKSYDELMKKLNEVVETVRTVTSSNDVDSMKQELDEQHISVEAANEAEAILMIRIEYRKLMQYRIERLNAQMMNALNKELF